MTEAISVRENVFDRASVQPLEGDSVGVGSRLPDEYLSEFAVKFHWTEGISYSFPDLFVQPSSTCVFVRFRGRVF